MPLNGSGTYAAPASTWNPAVTNTTVNSTDWAALLADLSTALSTMIAKDGQSTPTANIPMGTFKLTGLAAGSAAGHSVRWEQSAPGVVTTAGDLVVASASGAVTRQGVGSDGQVVVADSNQTNKLKYGFAALRSYLAGLTLSTAGGSATMTTAAGGATDSTNAQFMTLASATGKTTSAWAVGTGNGGLDTGAIANSTWYHFYLIMRGDTGVVDVLFSTSASAPTMPASYTYKRRIGSGKTDGSAQWTAFVQNGDEFMWAAPVADISSANPGTAAVTRTLTVPTGVIVQSILSVALQSADATTQSAVLLTDLARTDTAAVLANSQASATFSGSGNTVWGSASALIQTNTSAQIRSRLSFSSATVTLTIDTHGWNDRRGRDS